ncbi:integrase arm-type DNA-binding domain-containing protein [Candidatus Orientia mediorientalis]|nr:integrase arm-type DNA-binding domain-containing protein [Candidatus Orientia mediorientalis]
MSVKDASKKAKEYKTLMAKGIDPRERRRRNI